MKTAAVTPILGEFGYILFDIQPRVRAWLRAQPAERKVVFAPRALAPLFEEATEIIEPPADLLPTVPATMRSITYEHWAPDDPHRLKIDRLVQWARAAVPADAWLEIPYFQGQPWVAPAAYVQLASPLPPPAEPYIVIAARARPFDAWRNWPSSHWDDLVERIHNDWQFPVRAVGSPPDAYFPPAAIPQQILDAERLDHSISLLTHALCSISSNSGPTHLSLMTACPTFAWGEPYLQPMMERATNPLTAPCRFLPAGWDPSVDSIWHALNQWRQDLEAQGLWRTKPRVQLSMCMIARDSSHTIHAALASAKPWVDELIVVDTGSKDDTPAIAQAAGAQVFHSPWQDSFSHARNQSLRHACGRWILWMDSDDTIDPAQGQKLRDLAAAPHPPAIMGHVLQVQCPPSGHPAGYATATVVDHVKLFRNLPALRFTGRIHEQILPAIRALGCDVAWSDIHLTHSGADRTPQGRTRKQARDLRLLQLELADDPDNTFTLFNLGMTLLDTCSPEQALSPLARSLQLASPGESHVRKLYAFLLQAYTDLGRSASALKTAYQGLALYPNDPELLFRKGVIEQNLGRLDDAEHSFHSVVQTPPARYFSSMDRGILGIKAWHNLALIHEKQHRPDQAAVAWQHVIDHDPSNPAAWRGLLDALTAARDAPGLERIANLQPHDNAPTQAPAIARARLLTHRGQTRAAAAALEQALQIPLPPETSAGEPSIELLQELCELAFSANLLDSAQRALTDLTRRRPQDASAFQNLGAVYLLRHHYVKAVEYVKRSLELRPNHLPAQQLLEQAQSCISVGRASCPSSAAAALPVIP